MRHRESTAPKTDSGCGPMVCDEAAESREQRIAEAAYFIAESRGFRGDHALDDWLQAEAEIKANVPKREPHPLSL